MANMTEYPNGAPCWFELATKDVDGAKSFYAALFGWTASDSPMPGGGSYTMFFLGGRSIGGAYKIDPGMEAAGVPPHWDVYFNVADCDTATATAESLGGKKLAGPFDVQDYGRMSMIGDLEGAAFGIWQPNTHKGAGVMSEPNSVVWVELAARDTAAAAGFYEKLLAWTYKEQQLPQAGMYRELQVNGNSWGGLLQMTEAWGKMPSHWAIYIQVADVENTVELAKANGGQLTVPPFDAPGVGRIAMVADPSGTHFYIIKLTAAAA